MKNILFSSTLFLLLVSGTCNKKAGKQTYWARLEIAGACMNYTIKLLDGNLDSSKVMAAWTNEATGKTYTHVFALENPCHFPSDLKEGDEFYFQLDNSSKNDCITCMIYYPKPSKKLAITVIKK